MQCSTVCKTLAVAASLSLFAWPAGAQDAAPLEPVPAIWKSQDITFYFTSFNTFYSCSGLQRKLERVMELLGTKAHVRVRSADCQDPVARMPRVIMQVTAPVEATPDALAEREKGKSTRDLTARVQGKNPEEGWEQFPAQWKRISLGKALNLAPGDCELIEELRRKVLPKLAVRVTNDNLQCTPGQFNLGRPRLEVEALVEIPPPDAELPADSAAPESAAPPEEIR